MIFGRRQPAYTVSHRLVSVPWNHLIMRRFPCLLLIGGLYFGICATSCLAREPVAATPRQPLPDADSIKASQDIVRQAYEDDFKATGNDLEPLIRKLLAAAEESNDPASDYVLFLEAEKAAVAGGAVSLALEAVDARAGQFEIDGLLARTETIANCLAFKARPDVGMLKVLWDHAVETAERGLEQEALPQAKKAAEVAGNVAKAIFAAGRTRKDEALVTEGEEKQTLARGLIKTIGRRSGLLSEYRKAAQKLVDDANDPKANGIVGRYLCFERDSWAEGLPALVKGDKEELAAAAASELELFAADAKRPEAREVLAVADAWWQASEADAARRHAAALYERVLPDIGDPTKRALAAKRIAAANPEAEPQRKAAKGPDAPGKRVGGRRIVTLDVPTSTVLPVPREVSAELVPLLLTADEVRTLQNRLNVTDDDLAGLRSELWRRIHSAFGIAKWTMVDVLYLVELNERLSALLGRYEWPSPTGHVVSGVTDDQARNACRTAIAAAWILTAKNEEEFVRRARALPAGVLDQQCVEQSFNESEIKRWLVGLGDDYAAIPRKAQALDSLIQAGLATPGILHYREELGRAMATGQR
jgi:hypothetical protein